MPLGRSKLIDVFRTPRSDFKLGGYEFMTANDVFRGRFSKSLGKPVALVQMR